MSKNCFACAKTLAYNPYYIQHGEYYCTNCYEVQFCKTCVGCKQKIKAGQHGLTWRNTPWHDNCFNCTQCNISLLQRWSSLERNNLPYCSKCFDILFSPKCDKCNGVIESGTPWIGKHDRKLHPHCFRCSQCNISLTNQTYYNHNEMPYCPDCDTQLFCPKCARCNQVIHRGTRYLEVDRQKIHSTCFTCFGCGRVIEGLHSTRNGHNYHSYCVDNSYFRERRASFHGEFNNSQRPSNQAKDSHRPVETIQQAIDEFLTTITTLNLRSSTAKSSQIRHSTANLPNLLNSVNQANNNASSQFVQEASFDTAQKCSDKNELPHSILATQERAQTAAPIQHSSGVVEPEEKIEKQTVKYTSKLIKPDVRFKRQIRSRKSSNLSAIPSSMWLTKHDIKILPKPIPRKMRTCQVCYEDKPLSLYCEPVNHQCIHRERVICNQCTYLHVRQAFQKMCRDDVYCPEPDCNITFDYDAIKKLLLDANDTDLFQRYDRFYLEHQLERMPEFIWCAHSCGSGQLADHGVENNIVTCAKCDKKSCFTHRTKWHTGLTCANYDDQTDPGRRATEQWLAQKTKNCPQCQSSIEKTSGCDHMTCTHCHFEFCWACLADYMVIRQNGNHYHHRHCKHFRPYD